MSEIDNRKEPVAEVLERELEVLYRVAKKMTFNDADAEDLVGQTIVIAFQNWDSFDGKHARSWLIRVLRNEWLQVLRKRKVRKEVDIDQAAEPSDEGFWKTIERKLETETVLRALNEVHEDFRIVVAMCDIEEMTYEEISLALDVPVGTVKSRLFRGRKLLRSKLVSIAENESIIGKTHQ